MRQRIYLAMTEQKSMLKRKSAGIAKCCAPNCTGREAADGTKMANLYARAREAALTLVMMGDKPSIE